MEFITQNIQRMIELFRKFHNKDSRNEPTSSWSLRTVFPQRSGRTTIETRTLICTNEERKDIPSPGKTKRWMIILGAESTEIYCLNPKQDFRIILGKEKREWQSSLWPADSLSCGWIFPRAFVCNLSMMFLSILSPEPSTPLVLLILWKLLTFQPELK